MRRKAIQFILTSLIFGFRSYYGRDRNAPAMNDYRLVMGIGCLLMFILSFAPIVLARASSYRFKLDQDRRLTPQQLRVVIRSLNLVLVLFAVGMVSYGGTAMTYLFSVDINIASAVYSVYGLIYCGVTILLAAICGFWVSITTRRNVVKFYSNYLAPLVFTILLAASIVSFVNLGSTNDFSSGDFKSKNVSIDTIKSELSTELLISGILCIFCAIFLLISRWVCVRLYMNMDEDYGAGAGPGSMEEAGTRFKYGNTLTIRKRMAARNWREWLLITYGLVGGLFCIYFKVTIYLVSFNTLRTAYCIRATDCNRAPLSFLRTLCGIIRRLMN